MTRSSLIPVLLAAAAVGRSADAPSLDPRLSVHILIREDAFAAAPNPDKLTLHLKGELLSGLAESAFRTNHAEGAEYVNRIEEGRLAARTAALNK
jgi:hypothetical protein